MAPRLQLGVPLETADARLTVGTLDDPVVPSEQSRGQRRDRLGTMPPNQTTPGLISAATVAAPLGNRRACIDRSESALAIG
jgi:hypothetical protein